MNTELSPRAAEIAQHAKTLITQGGYHGFSYADISERVGIGKPSIHHHFPGKADLVRTTVSMHRAQTRAGLAALDRRLDDPLARLGAYTHYWAECIRNDAPSVCLCAMLAAELPSLPPEVAQEVRSYFRELSAWLARLLEQGAARGQLCLRDTPAAEAEALMSTVYGAMLTARALGAPEVFESITRAAVSRLAASN